MLRNYLKIAYRVLLRQKFFTIVSLFGISVTLTVIFVLVAMLDSAITPGGRGSKLARALFCEQITLEGEDISIGSSPSYAMLERHMRALKTPEAVSIHSSNQTTTVYVGSDKVELQLKHTDAVFWDIVEFDFVEGAPYNVNQVTNAEAVAVISDRARNQVFGKRSVCGEYLETTSGILRILGVVPVDQMPGQSVFADIWVPITQSAAITARTEPYGSEMAIVLPGAHGDEEAIKQEFETHMDAVRAEVSGTFHTVKCSLSSQLEIMSQQMFGENDSGPALMIALVIGLIILFMILPAMNLVNMTVSRIYERSSEIGVRKAFGASAATLVGQFVVENVLLTLVGGALAVVFSLIVLGILNESGVMPYAHYSLNVYVLLYSVIASLFFGVFSGVLPAYRMSRLHPVQALRGVTT